MNAVKVLLRNRTACAVGNRFYATAKKKIPDPDEEESLPSKYYYNQLARRHYLVGLCRVPPARH